jgi:hypothetical protein
MQITIKQVNCELIYDLYGKWYSVDSEGKVFHKNAKVFVQNIHVNDLSKGCSSSPGFMAHMIKNHFPQATIIIEPNQVPAQS